MTTADRKPHAVEADAARLTLRHVSADFGGNLPQLAPASMEREEHGDDRARRSNIRISCRP